MKLLLMFFNLPLSLPLNSPLNLSLKLPLNVSLQTMLLTILLSVAVAGAHKTEASVDSQLSPTYLKDLTWQLRRDEDGIRLSTAKVAKSAYRAAAGEMKIKAPLNYLVNVIRTTELCSRWVYHCESSHRLKALNPYEDIIYTATDMPFPLKDREVVAHIQWQQNEEDLIITGIAKAIPRDVSSAIIFEDELAQVHSKRTKKLPIRIEQADTLWELIPLADGEVLIKIFAHINPAGRVPSWMVNILSIEVPFKTLQDLRTLIADKTPVENLTIFKAPSSI